MSNDSDIDDPISPSFGFENRLNNHQGNTDNEAIKSRISSASRKIQNERSPSADNPSVDEFSNDVRSHSVSSFHQYTSQQKNSKLINEKPWSIDFDDNEHQETFRTHSRAFVGDDELDNNFENINDERSHSPNSKTNQIHAPSKDKNQYDKHHQTHFDYKEERSVSPVNRHKNDKPNLHNSSSNLPDKRCQYATENKWVDPHTNDDDTTKTPEELENEMKDPNGKFDGKILDRIEGSLIGLALGDALGAHVEFRPYQYMVENPVKDLEGGGTWGLRKGQFTDDTSMALCLANSLIARHDFIPYDQLIRYKYWYRLGYMSSTGQCFDIGAATSQAIHEFEDRQKKFAEENNIDDEHIDKLSDFDILDKFDIYCSEDGSAGNGALMRLAPVPLFFYRNKYAAIEFSGRSGQITHGDRKSYDACRYYGALIVAALHGYTKKQILARNFYSEHKHWFGNEPLHEEILQVAEGSFKREKGHESGIRGKGYIVNALEAALWAFWSDDDSFEKGVLAAVNLGDDTDTTAAIYGQLAGAFYGYKKLPQKWAKEVYANKFIRTLSKWIYYEGEQWENRQRNSSSGEHKSRK